MTKALLVAAALAPTAALAQPSAETASAVAPAAAAPLPTAPTTPAGMVHVHVETNEPNAVLARVGSSMLAYGSNGASASAIGFDRVCAAPCDLDVAGNQEYAFLNVSGFGGHSHSFILSSAQPNVTLKVKSGSQNSYILGYLGTCFGGAGIIIGGTFAGVGAGIGNGGFETAGIVTLAITVPMTILGIRAIVKNGTTVTNTEGREIAQRKHKAPRIAMTANGFAF